jgi:hypothetical protein
MAQAYVEETFKKLNIKEDINEKEQNTEKKDVDKVRRKLFCDETVPAVEEPIQKRSTTPLSFEKTVVFMFCKEFHYHEHSYCIPCFETTFKVDIEHDTRYLNWYEIPLTGVSYQATIRDYCCLCQKKLYCIVYPGGIAHF